MENRDVGLICWSEANLAEIWLMEEPCPCPRREKCVTDERKRCRVLQVMSIVEVEYSALPAVGRAVRSVSLEFMGRSGNGPC